MSALARAEKRIERHEARKGRTERRLMSAALVTVSGAISGMIPDHKIAGISSDLVFGLAGNAIALAFADSKFAESLGDVANGSLAVAAYKVAAAHRK